MRLQKAVRHRRLTGYQQRPGKHRLNHEATRKFKPLRNIPAGGVKHASGTCRNIPASWRVTGAIGAIGAIRAFSNNHISSTSLQDQETFILGVIWMRSRGTVSVGPDTGQTLQREIPSQAGQRLLSQAEGGEATTPRLIQSHGFYTFCCVPHASRVPGGDSWAIHCARIWLFSFQPRIPQTRLCWQIIGGPSFGLVAGICRQYYSPFSYLAHTSTAELLFPW